MPLSAPASFFPFGTCCVSWGSLRLVIMRGDGRRRRAASTTTPPVRGPPRISSPRTRSKLFGRWSLPMSTAMFQPEPWPFSPSDSGNSISSSRKPDSCRNSNRFPATVEMIVGRLGPMFSTEKLILALPNLYSAFSWGNAAPGKDGCLRFSISSTDSTLAAKRSRSSSVSPGTRVKVPVDCSPAIDATASVRSIGVSTKYSEVMRCSIILKIRSMALRQKFRPCPSHPGIRI